MDQHALHNASEYAIYLPGKGNENFVDLLNRSNELIDAWKEVLEEIRNFPTDLPKSQKTEESMQLLRGKLDELQIATNDWLWDATQAIRKGDVEIARGKKTTLTDMLVFHVHIKIMVLDVKLGMQQLRETTQISYDNLASDLRWAAQFQDSRNAQHVAIFAIILTVVLSIASLAQGCDVEERAGARLVIPQVEIDSRSVTP